MDGEGPMCRSNQYAEVGMYSGELSGFGLEVKEKMGFRITGSFLLCET